MKRFLVLTMFLTLLLGISGLWATVINVPTDQLTIKAAITVAAATGDEIVLQDDFTILTADFMHANGYALMISGKSLTLDLNGHTITAAAEATIYIGGSGTLVLEDSSVAGTGKVISTDYLAVGNFGTFTMQSGTLESSDAALYNYNNMDHIGDPEFGTVLISGGTLTGGGNYCVLNCGDLKISGGSFHANFCGINNSGKMTITNNLVSNGLYLQNGTFAQYVEDKGTLIIETNGQITGVDNENFILIESGAKITAVGDNNLGFPIGTTTAAEECWIFWNATNQKWEQNVVNITQFKSYETIQAAITAANPAGDVIQVADGIYDGKISINKSITLLSVNGADATIIQPTTGGQLGTIHVPNNVNNVTIGSIGHGFTIKGFDGAAGNETAAVYLLGPSNNIVLEGNILEAIGDAALMGPYNAVLNNITINANNISGKTFVGDNPAGVGFGAQNTLLDVPRQLVVFGGGPGTTNTQNFTFTNNIISGIAGGMSVTNDAGQAIPPTAQGNTLVTLDLAGTNTITGNIFSGITTRYAEALRVRGPGAYTISGNNFSGIYPINITADTSTPSVGIARIAVALPLNTFAKSVTVFDSSNNLKYNGILTSIQGGIAAATSGVGDVVNVGAGTYPEQLTISKALTLNGEDGAILDGSTLTPQWTTGVKIRSGNVTFNNIDIKNYTQDGLTAYKNIDMPNLHITNCKVSNIQPGNHGFGIYVGYESEGFGYTPPHLTQHLDFTGLLIEGNEITNTHSAAIVIQSLTGTAGTLIVRDNNIHHNTTNDGIWIDCARNLIIEDNIVEDNKFGIELSAYAEFNIQNGPYGPKDIIIRNNEVKNSTNDGIALFEGWPLTINIENNILTGNSKDVHNYLNDYLDASPNYWGYPSPQTHVTGRVTYDPWWVNEEMTILSSDRVLNFTQQISYATIQAAIDAAVDGDFIEVAGGTYDEALNIVAKTNLTITGIGTRALTILKPSTVIPWNYFGHTTARRAAIRIVESTNVNIKDIVLDCDLIKNNNWHGVFYANSTGSVFNNLTVKNMYTDQAHYNDIGIYARAIAPFTPTSRATLSILNCHLIDTGRVGLVTHDYIHSTVQSSYFYKTTHTFGYGMEIGSTSTAVITGNHLYGFDTPAVSDGSTSAAIYIENAFTQTETGVSKPVTIEDNDIYNCQYGITVGNQFNNYAGDVDMVVNILGNRLTDNIESGIILTDEDKSNGSSVTAILTGNTITTTLATVDDIGIMAYTVGDGDLDVNMQGNTISGYDYGLFVQDYGTNPLNSVFNVSATAGTTGNTFSNASTAVYTGNVNWETLPTFTGNIFGNNYIQFANWGSPIDLAALEGMNTWPGGYFLVNNIIYGNASWLYVDVPDEVIPNSFPQDYSIKASHIEDLRLFTVRLKVPKADFVTLVLPAEQAKFAIGSAYSGYGFKLLMPVSYDGTSEPLYDIYEVTGTYGGQFDGITGDNKELFKVTLTSKADPFTNVTAVPAGCNIKIEYPGVVLRSEMNAVITCAGTVDGWVLIDSADPAVEITNAGDFTPMPYLIPYVGTDLVAPELDLKYTDDWNLATALYQIVAGTPATPPLLGSFSLEVDVAGVDGIQTLINDWTLPITGLADGSYTLYLLVTDEAGYYTILPWQFIIDRTPPDALTWVTCHTTPNADISVDLEWTNGLVAPDFIHVWALDYAEISTITTNPYPEYDPTNLIAPTTISNDIDPYNLVPSTLGWKRVAIIPVTTALTLNTTTWTATPEMARGYYYFTIYGVANNGQVSAAPAVPFYRESISYWPGDVSVPSSGTHAVDVLDIGILSSNWGLTPGDNTVDVGPSTDYARRSRPMPDNKVNFEDLMMFAMNYNNTNYVYYTRNLPEIEPVTVTLNYQNLGSLLQVSLVMDGNDGFVKGMDIPVAYGNGLQLQNVEIGQIWPESSLLLHTNVDGVVTVSCATLGFEPMVSGNGNIVTLTFAINGANTSLELQSMTARGWDNSEIEIVNNPTGNVDNEDIVNVIPDTSYLGKNYPNPFNPSTTIQFGLKDAGNVKLSIYNNRGQLIRSLTNENKSAGTYQLTWDGRDNNGSLVSSGIYMFRMETKDTIKTQKAMLLK